MRKEYGSPSGARETSSGRAASSRFNPWVVMVVLSLDAAADRGAGAGRRGLPLCPRALPDGGRASHADRGGSHCSVHRTAIDS